MPGQPQFRIAVLIDGFEMPANSWCVGLIPPPLDFDQEALNCNFTVVKDADKKLDCPKGSASGATRLDLGGAGINLGFIQNIDVVAEASPESKSVLRVGKARPIFVGVPLHWTVDYTVKPKGSLKGGLLIWTVTYTCSAAPDPNEKQKFRAEVAIGCK